MAHLYRLVRSFLLFLFLSFSGFVFASSPPSLEYRFTWSPGWSSSISAACQSAFDRANTANAAIGGLIDYQFLTVSCTGKYLPSTGLGSWTSGSYISRSVCPSGTVISPDGAVCSPAPSACKAGYEEQGGACVWKPDEFCGNAHALQNSTLSDRGPQVLAGQVESGPVCDPVPGAPPDKGCQADFERDMSAKKGDQWYSWGLVKLRGGSGLGCTTNLPEKEIKPSTCPKGKAPGTVNGVEVCYKIGDDSPVVRDNKAEETKKEADGSETKTEVKKKTECDGQTCTTHTTTTTTNTPGGGTGGTGSGGTGTGGTPTINTTTATTTCTIGPGCSSTGQNTISTGTAGGSGGVGGAGGAGSGGTGGTGGAGGAGGAGGQGAGGGGGDGGEHSQFAGECKAGFECDGDALMCAMAQEQHRRNCDLFVNETPESKLYDTAKALDQTKSVIEATEVNLTSSSFDTSNALGGGSCIGDKSVTVARQTLTIPFSSICPYLQNLGSVLMMVSFLVAMRIVARG